MNLWLCLECEFQLVIPENGCDTPLRRRHTTLLCLFVPAPRKRNIYYTRNAHRGKNKMREIAIIALSAALFVILQRTLTHIHRSQPAVPQYMHIFMIVHPAAGHDGGGSAGAVVLLPAAADCKNNTRCHAAGCCILQSEYAINIGVLVWKYFIVRRIIFISLMNI